MNKINMNINFIHFYQFIYLINSFKKVASIENFDYRCSIISNLNNKRI
jgi:hypothetical protein